MYIYIYVLYIYGHPPPPLDRPRKYVSGLFRTGGGGGGNTTPKFLGFPKIQKIQPRVPLFGSSSGSLKILKPSRFLEFPKFQNSKKIHPKVWIFGNSSGSLKIQKSSKFLDFPKFQKPKKKPTPKFGFLETRAGASKSKNRANSSSFQNSQPWGGFFWIFGILETRGTCSIFGF